MEVETAACCNQEHMATNQQHHREGRFMNLETPKKVVHLPRNWVCRGEACGAIGNTVRAPCPSLPLCDPQKPPGAYLAVAFFEELRVERRESALVCVPGSDSSATANAWQSRGWQGAERRRDERERCQSARG